MLKIGLTGGIGSGKSLVSQHLEKLGVAVIDADVIARKLLATDSPLLNSVRDTFGSSFFSADGQLLRKAFGQYIFTHAAARKQLESLLHPVIRSNMIRQMETLDAPYAVLVIPLLIETLEQHSVDRILVVDAPEQLQIQRIMQRDQLSCSEALTRLQAQATRTQRLAYADDVIVNDKDPEYLKSEAARLHHRYLDMAAIKH